MPHSSGGGSSGGGFHGGSSSGSSNHISTHYFAGARRYRRFYTDGRPDEYVYANSKPGKTGIGALVMIAVMGVIFMMACGLSVFTDKPKFLVPKYQDDPVVHDDIGVMEEKDKDELLTLMRQYNQLTGICPVIYTTFDEEWNKDYKNLEKFAYDKYVSNFSDEQHWVFVYSIPADAAEFQPGGLVTSSEFKWEAIQGDETDNILTESAFENIGKAIQKDLKAGKGPGTAFITGFGKAYESAKKKLEPGAGRAVFNTIISCIPLLITVGIFVPLFIIMLKQYKKDKAMDYEEVPLDVEPVEVPGLRSYINAKGGTVTEYKTNGYYSKSVGYDATNPAASKAVKIVSLVMLIPFILIGIGVMAGGVSIINAGTDRTGGIFMIGFGAVWTFISAAILIGLLRTSAKAKKMAGDPLTAEYPKAEYPDMKPVSPEPAKPAEQPEFDPQFFGSAKSDYESDDEDYKRMKRKGFE